MAAPQVLGQGELGTELAINNAGRRSHALAGCHRIPLSPESGYFQRSSSSLSASELLNSSSAPFPLYHGCLFLLSYLASNRLFQSSRLWSSRVLWASRAPLLLSSLRGMEKAPKMDLSYRSTISIYKVSATTKGCSCLPRGDVWVGGEELFSAEGSLV